MDREARTGEEARAHGLAGDGGVGSDYGVGAARARGGWPQIAEKLRAGASEDVRSQDDDDRSAECARRRRIRDTLEKLGWAL